MVEFKLFTTGLFNFKFITQTKIERKGDGFAVLLVRIRVSDI